MTLRTKLPNRCKHCKVRMPQDKAHHVIHPACIDLWYAIQSEKRHKARIKAAKAVAVRERKADAVKRLSQKSRGYWLAAAQKSFNEWVRTRDAALPCISCGRNHAGQYHAGHYLSVGARPELRFEPLNVHKQCSACNLHLSGNVILYRKGLIAKHGVEIVEWLEGAHALKHYDTDDLIEIKATHHAHTKTLKAQQ